VSLAIAASNPSPSPVIGDRPADEHRVAGLHPPGPELDARRHHSDARGCDREPVAAAPLDDLRIAGDDSHARPPRRRPHQGHDFHQVGDRKALFENEGGREEQGHRAAHRQVVDRAVDSQLADRAAGKDERLHDVGIGREGEPAAAGETAG
jgi:hypothetical protein